MRCKIVQHRHAWARMEVRGQQQGKALKSSSSSSKGVGGLQQQEGGGHSSRGPSAAAAAAATKGETSRYFHLLEKSEGQKGCTILGLAGASPG